MADKSRQGAMLRFQSEVSTRAQELRDMPASSMQNWYLIATPEGRARIARLPEGIAPAATGNGAGAKILKIPELANSHAFAHKVGGMEFVSVAQAFRDEFDNGGFIRETMAFLDRVPRYQHQQTAAQTAALLVERLKDSFEDDGLENATEWLESSEARAWCRSAMLHMESNGVAVTAGYRDVLAAVKEKTADLVSGMRQEARATAYGM